MFPKPLIYSVTLASLFAVSTHALAANTPVACNVILNKSPAWSKYDVTILMYNTTNLKPIASYTLSKASGSTPSVNSIKQSFNCQQYPQISFKASFSPPIWQNLAGQEYLAKNVWNLTPQLIQSPSNVTSINVTVNFPDDFVSVPALEPNLK